MKENTRLWGKRAMAVMLSAAMVGSTVPATAIADDLQLQTEPTPVQQNGQQVQLGAEDEAKTPIVIQGLKLNRSKVYDGTPDVSNDMIDDTGLEVFEADGTHKKLDRSVVESVSAVFDSADAGDRTVTFTFKVADAYTVDASSQTTEAGKITKKPVGVGSWEGTTFTYNGKEQAPTPKFAEDAVIKKDEGNLQFVVEGAQKKREFRRTTNLHGQGHGT